MNAPTNAPPADPLNLAGKTFNCRLLLGTSNYPNPALLLGALKASGAEIVTASIRRVNLAEQEETFLSEPELRKLQFLPNTAGCYTAKDAVLTAELAREALGTNWIKVEVIGDDYTLMPDAIELLDACKQLIQSGFHVFPYCPDDPVFCKRLEDIGCAAVMPLAAPIGSGLGVRNPHNLELIRRAVKIPVIVDAGVGTASDAALVMELGCDAILLNTAVAEAENPVLMAKAMRQGIDAGRNALLAGRIPKIQRAKASSPEEGLFFD